MSSAPTSPRPPLGRAGGHELLLEIASGGMATVYLGSEAGGDGAVELVAVKRPHRHLAQDERFSSMLVDEARLASAIDHPHVVKVRSLGFEEGAPFIVLDYVDGVALSDLLRVLSEQGRALAPRVAAKIVLDTLAGLHAAHTWCDPDGKPLGIIHRDVSPHNVLVARDGDSKITDFGIAKAEDRIQTTRTHEVKGKLSYLAPERVDERRMCTVQSDIFSVAAVFWECLVGRRLFHRDEALDILQDVMRAEIHAPRFLGVPVSLELDAVVMRSLSRDLGERYASADAFAVALREALGEEGPASAGEVAVVVELAVGEKLAAREAEAKGELLRRGLPEPPRPSQPLLSGKSDEERRALFDTLAPVVSARVPPPRIPTVAERFHVAWMNRRKRRAMIAAAAASALLIAVTFGFIAHGVASLVASPVASEAGGSIASAARPGEALREPSQPPQAAAATSAPVLELGELPDTEPPSSRASRPSHRHRRKAAERAAPAPSSRTKDGFTRLK